MRRALGLGASRPAAAGRMSGSPVVVHRNGRGGEPPVNRIAEAQTALAAERLAREHAEAALRVAETALREAETRRGHAELTRDEAVDALAAERQARETAEEQLAQLSAPLRAEPTLARRPRGRPRKNPVPVMSEVEDSPVEWWVPGWKAKLPGR